MKTSRTIILLLSLFAVAASHAQAWSDAYAQAMNAVRSQKWSEARTEFQKAIALRAEDQSDPTRLPGPITERRVWRSGAPYSANFGAAYAGIKMTMTMADDQSKADLTRTVAGEFETLLAKGQQSSETYYFLAMAYTNLRDVQKSQDLEKRYKALGGKFTWKVDAEILSPEDVSAIAALSGTPAGGTTNPGNGGNPIQPAAKLENKYALLIGNSDSRIKDQGLPFAANDVQMIREALIQFAGYEEKNVDMVTNGTAAQMKAAAEAMAERVDADSTIFLYFTGVGSNLDGKDYLAGVDSSSMVESATMYAKSELYQLFIKKGCKIFAFFQVNRPSNSGFYFGKEEPRFGQIAQTQATLPMSSVGSVVRGGTQVGLFTDAICGVIRQFHSNNIPIYEFGWQVFYYMRGGRTPGANGTGGSQQMTLPVVINMDPERTGF